MQNARSRFGRKTTQLGAQNSATGQQLSSEGARIGDVDRGLQQDQEDLFAGLHSF